MRSFDSKLLADNLVYDKAIGGISSLSFWVCEISHILSNTVEPIAMTLIGARAQCHQTLHIENRDCSMTPGSCSLMIVAA
jgi:hypothetical protein